MFDTNLSEFETTAPELTRSVDVDETDITTRPDTANREEEIYARIDEIWAKTEPDPFTEEDEKKLQKLEDQIDKIFEGHGVKPLSEEDDNELNALWAEIDEMYGYDAETFDDELTDEELVRSEEIFQRLDELWVKTQPEPFTEEEEKRLDDLHAQMFALFDDGDLTKEEEGKLTELEEQIEKIYEGHEFTPFSEEEQKEFETLQAELDELYGYEPEPFLDDLTAEEREREEEILERIDDIWAKTEPDPFTKEEENQIEDLFSQMEALFEDGELTEEEDVKLLELEEQVNKIFDAHDAKELSDEDQQELDALWVELDEIYGYEPEPFEDELTAEERERETEIYARMDEIWAKTEPDPFTEEEEAKIQELEEQIRSILESQEFIEPSEEDQKEIDALWAELDELHSYEPEFVDGEFVFPELTEEEKARQGEILERIDEIWAKAEPDPLTQEQEAKLKQLSEQINEIFEGHLPKDLSEEDQKELDALWAELDELYGYQPEPVEGEVLSLDTIEDTDTDDDLVDLETLELKAADSETLLTGADKPETKDFITLYDDEVVDLSNMSDDVEGLDEEDPIDISEFLLPEQEEDSPVQISDTAEEPIDIIIDEPLFAVEAEADVEQIHNMEIRFVELDLGA